MPIIVPYLIHLPYPKGRRSLPRPRRPSSAAAKTRSLDLNCIFNFAVSQFHLLLLSHIIIHYIQHDDTHPTKYLQEANQRQLLSLTTTFPIFQESRRGYPCSQHRCAVTTVATSRTAHDRCEGVCAGSVQEPVTNSSCYCDNDLYRCGFKRAIC